MPTATNRPDVVTKVMPYHTISMQYPPEHRNVHHDHDDCKNGKQIKLSDRMSGTGGKPRCEECTRLG
jgi:hypothetical protein